ncbi:MAG: family 1 glycosylhydrolase [Lachnospiraceae bacterium]|nr:family 1 glycosylhydrolase [Lachnospiraceae bacterium]
MANKKTNLVGRGYRQKILAPCCDLDLKNSLLAAHNTLLAHGMAVKVIREYSILKPLVGFSPQGHISYPYQVNERNIEAAKKHMFDVRDTMLYNNAWWMEPIYKGKYPEEGLKLFAEYMPEIGPNDMDIISQPLDFIGINSYGGTPVIMGEDGNPIEVKRTPGHPQNASTWPLDFDALYWGAKFFYGRYGLPIMVTENGLSMNDWVHMDGKVHDEGRIDFVKRNLLALNKAYQEGIPMLGYFLWSFLDNLEWYHGYAPRFGIVHVDYETQKRTIKDSGWWYSQVVKTREIV